MRTYNDTELSPIAFELSYPEETKESAGDFENWRKFLLHHLLFVWVAGLCIVGSFLLIGAVLLYVFFLPFLLRYAAVFGCVTACIVSWVRKTFIFRIASEGLFHWVNAVWFFFLFWLYYCMNSILRRMRFVLRRVIFPIMCSVGEPTIASTFLSISFCMLNALIIIRIALTFMP